MFTGIIQDVGQIASAEHRAGDLRLEVRVGQMDLKRQALGDSIAVSGVCLTVVEFGPQSFFADLSRETLGLTTASGWQPGDRVNLEPALRAGDALGGHLVSGHVDGIAEILSRSSDARSEKFTLHAPGELARFIARKGSVALDGVSLTVNAVDGERFDVNLIPHTQNVTTLGGWRPGVRVNLEIDVIARYAERLMSVAS